MKSKLIAKNYEQLQASFIATVATYRPLQTMKAKDAIKWYIGHTIQDNRIENAVMAKKNYRKLAQAFDNWTAKNVDASVDEDQFDLLDQLREQLKD